jgi:hypothetical protein
MGNAFSSWEAVSPVTVIVKVKVTLRLTVSQSVSLGVEPHLGLMPDIFSVRNTEYV